MERILPLLVVLLSLASQATSQTPGGSWTPTGSMPSKRVGYTATLLGDGTVLIVGGSQGAKALNECATQAVPLLISALPDLKVVHQTGERDYNAIRVAYARREFQAEVVPFIENMAERFAQADLIVCRSGAITVAEVSASGRAAIFIPFGASTDAHQTRNAAAMQENGAARLLPQDELTPERLTNEIFSLLDQPRRIQEMEDRARALAHPRAVEDIVDLLEGVARR